MFERSRFQILCRAVLDWIVQKPLHVVCAVAAVTVLFALQIPHISFQTSVYDLIIEDLPETAVREDFEKVFGSDEMIRLVVRCENVFEPATFRKIQSLHKEAERIAGVRRVISLPAVKEAVDPGDSWDMERFSRVILPVELFRNNLVSDDRTTTVLNLLLEEGADHERVISAVDRMIEREGTGLSLYQIGMPLVSQALVRFTEKDFFRLPPFTLALIAGMLLLLYRNFRGLFLPLICVLTALVWTFGLMAAVGIPISMLTMIVPVFLIAVGTAYCLHIVSEYFTCAGNAEIASRQAAVVETYRHVAFPTALAVLTTVIGLASLLVNRIPSIREFAVFACFGILFLLLIVLTLLPALMVLLPRPKARFRSPGYLDRWFASLIEAVVRVNLHHQKIALPAIAAVTALGIAGIFQLRVETNPVGYFKENTSVSRHFHDIYRNLSGSFPLYVLMASDRPDYFENPLYIQQMARLQAYLETLPGVDKTVSFADYLKLVNYASNQFDPAHYRLPEEDWELRMLINSYRMMLGDELFDRFMTADLSQSNILMLTHISSSRQFLETRKAILSHVRDLGAGPLRWQVTGFGMVISSSSQLLTRGQIQSLSITMVLVFAIMFLLFLSLKVGLIAAATNLFPIVVNFGVMGWLGIELSMATGLIASIAIGLGVDDAIHYLVRFNREFRKDLNEERALRETLHQVGRPILFTTLSISIGFSVLALSSFQPTAVFGLLMVLTMASALIGDVVLLPCLMRHVELVTLWDLVRLKLGKEPRKGIPLFQGMSRTEVHYICMAGALRKMEGGEVLFHKGDASDESMFAVVSGDLDVLDHDIGEDPTRGHAYQKRLVTLHAGDVVGEMGMLRSSPRSASVVALGSAELLQINMKMIRRLQWLYPPTAHKFSVNLMKTLCDRIENVSHCLFESSVVDDMTGLCNRKSLMQILEKEVFRSQRYGCELSLCLLEVGNNAASWGEQAPVGDAEMKIMTDAILTELRRCDTLGRMDARTFALIMPQTPGEHAQTTIDRICKLLESCISGQGFQVPSLRCGVASYRSNPATSAQTLYDRAQQGLSSQNPSP
ncbi:MAG: MMPL family transporter [Desulfobacteraceae bacterium]|nr:MMPL family transporter [Desulfobacteraceae bacterium]